MWALQLCVAKPQGLVHGLHVGSCMQPRAGTRRSPCLSPRMCLLPSRLDLMVKIQQNSRPAEDGSGRPHRRPQRVAGEQGGIMRDSNIELLSVMLEALSKEHDILYQSLLTPITAFVMELLPDQHRETTKNELAFEDLYVMTVSRRSMRAHMRCARSSATGRRHPVES